MWYLYHAALLNVKRLVRNLNLKRLRVVLSNTIGLAVLAAKAPGLFLHSLISGLCRWEAPDIGMMMDAVSDDFQGNQPAFTSPRRRRATTSAYVQIHEPTARQAVRCLVANNIGHEQRQTVHEDHTY